MFSNILILFLSSFFQDLCLLRYDFFGKKFWFAFIYERKAVVCVRIFSECCNLSPRTNRDGFSHANECFIARSRL